MSLAVALLLSLAAAPAQASAGAGAVAQPRVQTLASVRAVASVTVLRAERVGAGPPAGSGEAAPAIARNVLSEQGQAIVLFY